MNSTRASEAIAAWLRGGTPDEPRTQESLARRLSPHIGRNLNQATISNLAHGRSLPRAELMGAFHIELGIRPEWWWESATNSLGPIVGGVVGRSGLRAHRAASLFPLATDAELEELASDIQANGLRSPIVLIKNGKEFEVLDGRNRLLACGLAGIAPTYVFWRGADPIAFVVSANLKRRHLTTDQRGPLGAEIARLYVETAQRHGGPSSPEEREPSEDPQNASGPEHRAGHSVPNRATNIGSSFYRPRRAKRPRLRLGGGVAGIPALREDPASVVDIATDATDRPSTEILGAPGQSAAEEPG